MHILSLLKANLRYKKDSFISVLLLMCLIAMILTSVMSISQNSKARVDDSLAVANIGDLTLWFDDGVLKDETIDKIKALEEVDKVDIVKAIYAEKKDKVKISGKKAGEFFEFQSYDTKNHPFAIFSNDGIGFEKNPIELNSGEIYLPVCFKTKYSSKLGDKVSINTKALHMMFTVKGFLEEPTMGNPVVGGYKNVFISKSDFDKMLDTYNQEDSELGLVDVVQVYRAKDFDINDSEFKTLLDKNDNFVKISNNDQSKNQFMMYSSIIVTLFTGVISLFGLLLFVVILIVIGHNITSSIEMDYTNLGILKSQGFTGRNLRQVYIYQYLLAEVIGSAIGFVLGIFTTGYISALTVQITGLFSGSSIAVMSSVIVIAILIVCSVLFVVAKSRGISKISPMKAIAGTRETKKFSLKLKSKITKRGLSFWMALRQLTTNAKQYLSSAVIVAILVFFIMAVSTIITSLGEDNILEEFYGFNFDIEIAYEGSDNLKAEVEKLIKEYSDIKSTEVFHSDFFTIGSGKVLGNVVESGASFTNILEGRAPEKSNEVVVTKVFAENYGVKIGDKLAVGLDTESKEYNIVGYYQSVNAAGLQFSMLTSGFRQLNYEEDMDTYDYKITDRSKIEEIADVLDEKYGSDISVTTSSDVMSDIEAISSAAKFSIYLIYGVSIIFIIVVAFMVCGKIFMKEKNDYGIFKSTGFTSENLRIQFSLRFFMVACIGAVLGALLNIFLSQQLMGMMLKSFGITNFSANYTVMSFVIPIGLISITFLCCAYLISGRIKKVSTKILIVE